MVQQCKLLLIVFASFVAADSYAQRVYEDNGKVIMDASLIPNKPVPKARDTDGTMTEKGTNKLDNLSSDVSNEKVFRKFEIRKEDASANPMPADQGWLAAIHFCRDLTEDGGGWRLPTGRELVLMLLFKNSLHKIASFQPFIVDVDNDPYYWSATEPNNRLDIDAVQIKSVGTPDSHVVWKSFKNGRVRCIRDITQ